MAEARAVSQLRPASHLGSAEDYQDATIYLVSVPIWKMEFAHIFCPTGLT